MITYVKLLWFDYFFVCLRVSELVLAYGFRKCVLVTCLYTNMSCFMNMINFYLLKDQSEFLHVKQKQLPGFKVSVCISAHSWSSDSAIQVTCFVR